MFRSLGLPMLVLSAIAGFALATSMVPCAYAATQPTIQLTSISHPHTVAPGMTFQVEINAWYSDKFLADVGIWDSDAGVMVQSMTFISQFFGPGNVSFVLTLTAPKSLGPWHLIAINRVWWQNAWYQDPKGSEQSFTVAVANSVTLTIGSYGSGTRITVDDSSYQIQNESSLSLSLQPGAHVLSAPMIIQPSPDERYVFAGWSNGVNSNPHTIYLTVPSNLTAFYRTEYFLSVQSGMGQSVGEGWYEKDSIATVAVTPTIMVPTSFGSTDDYRFTGWSGDSSSISNVVTLTMDGPKQVVANWTEAGPIMDTRTSVSLLLLCSLVLLGRLTFIRFRHRRVPSTLPHKSSWTLTCTILVLLVVTAVLPTAHAQSLPEPRAATIKIGDAEWYYWDQPGSDTCLIWLGGGIPEESQPGSYGYFINPFDYESFGTIRFIQDLSSFYCVIALQQGAVQSFDPTANRTIHQELFQPQTTTIEAVHRWITEQGYTHTFVVGYSVGGQAAAADLTLSHPDDWSSKDGIILITVPFSQDVISNANELRTNLFLIYGGNLLDYEATGMQFYNKTQPEGFHGTQYIHKEFHVIDDVGHEVWTIRATGAYDTRALNLVIGFIETSKARQIGNGLQWTSNNSTGTMAARILSVQAPVSVKVAQGFRIQCNVTFKPTPNQELILAAYVNGQNQSLTQVSLTAGSTASARLIVPPTSNNTTLEVSLIVLEDVGGRWVQASNVYHTTVAVTNLATLTIRTSHPDLSFSFDGTLHATNSSGLTTLEVSVGPHVIEVQPLIYLNNASRLRFTGWEDSTNQTLRRIDLEGGETIEASYVQQYLVQVDSVYGQAVGSGWYDENSTDEVVVQPPILSSPPVIFSHWAGPTNQSQVRVLLQVSSPTLVSAVWESTGGAPQSSPIYQDPWFISSLIVFIILLLLNVRMRPSKRES